jgi:hypothetical protein
VAGDDDELKSPANCPVVSLSSEPDSLAARIRRLQWEARVLAGEQVKALCADLDGLAARALEIAEGGEAYPAGVRELASRIAADLPEKAKVLLTLQQRNGPG